MAYIIPNTNVKIYRNIPIDDSYTNTLYFASTQAQTSYFHSVGNPNLVKSLNSYSYQRVNRNTIRVQSRYDEIYNCNYLAFQNANFENKWFYAFIDTVDYINNDVTEISYTIDVIQTWLMQTGTNEAPEDKFEDCFIIRQHTATDTIGSNVVPEDVQIGQYVTSPYNFTNLFTNWRIVMVATAEIEGGQGTPLSPANAEFFGGVLHNADIKVYQLNQLSQIKDDLTLLSVLNRANTVVAMYMCPLSFIPKPTSQNNTREASLSLCQVGTHTLSNFRPTSFGNYTPKNNKMFTYPYCYFTGSNQQGETREYKYEYFKFPSTITFKIVTDGNALNPVIAAIPINYMQGTYETETLNTNKNDCMENALQITNLPKCTWATSDLGAKLVQAGISLAIMAASKGAISIPPKFATEINPMALPLNPYPPNDANVPLLNTTNERGIVPYGSNMINNAPLYRTRMIREGINQKPILDKDEAVVAGLLSRDIMNSHISSFLGEGDIAYANNFLDFGFKQVYLAPPFAKIIDDYFTMYGYAINDVGKPNLHARNKWTYIKTANCQIKGNIPNDDRRLIQDIFNNGIRFWVNASEVGNYTLTNSILAQGGE